ncbi:MAG TPA: hypothetical protein VFQ39_07245 [Longimicrobium sp.]|nr:hypothetical protein [Longimicrobium sp.]
MRKLGLDVETLKVTSFEVDGVAGTRGTVEGRLNQERVSNLQTCEGVLETCAFGCAGPANSRDSACGGWLPSLAASFCVCSVED